MTSGYGVATATAVGPWSDAHQFYVVLQPNGNARVSVTMSVRVTTCNTFELHLYAADESNSLSSQLTSFSASVPLATAGVGYITFDMTAYTLTSGTTYVLLVTPTAPSELRQRTRGSSSSTNCITEFTTLQICAASEPATDRSPSLPCLPCLPCRQ